MVFLRGGVYYYEFNAGGKRFRGSCGTKNYNSALQVERKKRRDIQESTHGIVRKTAAMPTLIEFEGRFKAELTLRHSERPETLVFYSNNYKKLCDFPPLGTLELDQIDEAVIDEFNAHCALLGLSKGTTNRRLATLRKCLRFAMRQKIIKGVPNFRLFPEPPSRDFVLSHEEEHLYLSRCPKHLSDLAILSLESGMRLGECLKLRWEDVYFDASGIGRRPYIHCKGTKSRMSNRKIPLSSRLHDHLLALYESRLGPWVLACVRDGSRQASKNTLEKTHERLREKYKYDPAFVIHSFRHTMASRLGEEGVGVFTIQRLLGHSSITMSQRYVHPTAGDAETAFDRMDQAREERTPTTPTRYAPTSTPVPPNSPPVVRKAVVTGYKYKKIQSIS